MSKTLRTAAIIVGAVALIATGVGAAAGAGIITVSAGTAATIGTVATVANVGAATLSVASVATAKPPPLGGSATRFKADKDAGLPYVIGRTATGGNIIYRRTHNTAGYALPDLQSFGVVLSCAGPINAIDSFSADRVTVSFSGGNAVGTYATWMFQTQQLGASPESAALRVTPGGTLPPGWTTAAKLSGLSAAMWTLRYDQKGKFYPQGVPLPLWVVQGVKVYDPRLDSTYPGGSGACRAGVESTYVYSQNPYLHALAFAIGRYQNGKRVIGIGAPIGGIDVRAFVEGANVADANGWTVGGVITSADNKWAVLKAILQAGGGKPMHLGAMLSCTVQTPRVALATVTTDDLIGEARVTATTSRRERINSIVPRYRSEAHDWEVIPAAPVTVAAHVATDGGLRTREITYSMVQVLDQAAALARYDIEDAREFGPVVLPLKLRWLGYRPGDCISVNLPEVGLNGQDIIIANREIDAAALSVVLTARSETFGKHAFALGQTGVAPPTASTSTPPVPPQPSALAWSLSGAGLVSGATVTPALIVTGAAASVPIDAVVIEYRLWVSGQAADVGWIGNGAYLPDMTRVEITAVLPSTAYEIAVSYRLGAFTGARRVIGPVTTTAAGLEWSGVGGTGRPENGATVNDAGDYMNRNGSYEFALRPDGTIPGWRWDNVGYAGDVTVINYAADSTSGTRMAQLQGQVALISDSFTVRGGEPIWCRTRFGVNTGGPAAEIQVLFRSFDITGAATDTGIDIDTYAAGAFYTRGVVSFICPAGAVKAQLIFGVDLAGAPGVTGSAVFVDYFQASRTEFGADVTSTAVPSLSVPPLVTINYDFDGTASGGALPATLRAVRKRGDADVSATTSWSLTGSGFTATIGSDGEIEITATTASSTMTVVSARDGVTLSAPVAINRFTGAPPSGGGSGGTSASHSSIDSIASNSYGAAIAGPLTVTTGSAGQINLSAPLTITRGATAPAGTFGVYLKWQWRIVGGSYADAAAEVGETTALVVTNEGGGFYTVEDGSVTCNVTLTGLSAATDYEVQLLGRTSSGSTSRGMIGTATAVGS